MDGKKLLPVENVVDELVEIAGLHGVKVTVIEKRQDLLRKYGGIAEVQFLSAAATTAKLSRVLTVNELFYRIRLTGIY
jgi:hypothetical protein